MNVIGIVVEYNPFHNGHLYQINKIKEKYPNSLTIVILGGSFMERGEVSILNKWDKTKISLDNNIDIVVELPFVFASQSADIFAHGAIAILNYLGIDTLVFGSEDDNLDNLIKLAKIQLDNPNYDKLVKEYLDMGINYPTALSKALETISSIKIDKPNDLLGLSYVREIIKNNYNINITTIKRTNNYHGNNKNTDIISASEIRSLINNNINIKSYVPTSALKYLNDIPDSNKYFELLKYQIINNIDSLSKFQTVDEGIENRIKKYIFECDNIDDLIKSIKTKRYTYNKLNRMFTHILTNFTKSEAGDLVIDYIRLLGFNNKGKNYLNKIKKEIMVPIITKYESNKYKLFDIEMRVSYIYSLLIDNGEEYIKLENKNKPIIK